jgi:hypothetical protein
MRVVDEVSTSSDRNEYSELDDDASVVERVETDDCDRVEMKLRSLGMKRMQRVNEVIQSREKILHPSTHNNESSQHTETGQSQGQNSGRRAHTHHTRAHTCAHTQSHTPPPPCADRAGFCLPLSLIEEWKYRGRVSEDEKVSDRVSG